jgi:hypothetical protein
VDIWNPRCRSAFIHKAIGRLFGPQEDPMSDDVQIYIEGQRGVIRQLSERGLPTYKQASILRKLISERNAAAAEARIRLYARPASTAVRN